MKPHSLFNRADKLALVSKIVSGNLTRQDVAQLQKSYEPMFITLNLGDAATPQAVNDPTYHIEISNDWKQSRRYWKYADGRIEEID